MHLMVSHFEGGVKRARVGAAHVCAPNMSFTRVWHLAWAFGKPKRQNRVSVHAAAKPSVGHTLAPSLATVQCRIEMYVAQYPQKWYQVEALNVIKFMTTLICNMLVIT